MKQLFTIGYEGAVLDDFLAVLERERVDVLLDIREAPISRRKEFSKNALRGILTKAGIEYHHEKLLGTPKLIRDKFKEDNDSKAFFKAFNRHLQKQNTLLQKLTEEISGNVALMCYERDYTQCHRLAVAKAISGITGLLPKHLEVSKNEFRNTLQMPFSNF